MKTPLELETELSKISQQLGYKARLPSMYFEELENLLDAAEECLIFNIEIPLLGLDNYLLYKILHLPTLINGHLRSIKPEAEFMTINISKGFYYLMNQTEVKECKSMKNILICEERHALHRINDKSHCEVLIKIILIIFVSLINW